MPASRCHIDHRQPWAHHPGRGSPTRGSPGGGRTDADNGQPLCLPHNLLKELGFTATLDERGRTHIYRPDGTEIR